MQSDGWPAVRKWHQAVNQADLELAADVLVGGPKGAGQGRDLFLEWVASAGIHLIPVASHEVDPTRIAVEQDATWHGNDEPARVVTLFRVENGLVAEAMRYSSLEEALASAH